MLQMISCLGNYLDRRASSLPEDISLYGFFDFLGEVVGSQSLVVSIPVLVTWTRLLHNHEFGHTVASTALLGHLLNVCSSRLIQYESLPDDTRDPTYLFLMEDTDTPPERHAFLGNYRRYSSQVIESIVMLKLVDAFQHILGQADDVLNNLYAGNGSLDGQYMHPCAATHAGPLSGSSPMPSPATDKADGGMQWQTTIRTRWRLLASMLDSLSSSRPSRAMSSGGKP